MLNMVASAIEKRVMRTPCSREREGAAMIRQMSVSS